MKISAILKPVPFFFECIRILFIIFLLRLDIPLTSIYPWLAFTAAGILLPVTALFIWLDITGYRAFIPLYISGKCISIVTLLIWLISGITGSMGNETSLIFLGAGVILLTGDLFALAAVSAVSRSRIKHSDTEDE